MIEGLNSSVYDILKLVEVITGKGFDFQIKPDLEAFAATRMARSNMPKHIMFYKAEHSDIMNHLIAHECGHIIRLFIAPPEKRVMADTSNKTKESALLEIQDDLTRLNNLLGFDRTAKIINMWYTVTVRHLTNYPPDIRHLPQS